MDKKLNENIIISALRMNSSNTNPNYTFKNQLLNDLSKDLKKEKRNMLDFMKLKSKGLVTVSSIIMLLLLLGGTSYILINKSQNNDRQNTASEMPADKFNTLKDAESRLNFVPKIPGKSILNESLKEISIPQMSEGTSSDMSKDLYLTYEFANNKKAYQIMQTTRKDFDIQTNKVIRNSDQVELKVERVNINGNTGIFFTCKDMNPDIQSGKVISNNEVCNDSGETSEGPLSQVMSRNSVYWNDGKVSYIISEYGEVSKEKLIDLASSLKNYK